MILVDICVPAVDKVYDFEIDGCGTVAEVTESLAELICQREQCCMTGEIGDLTLWRMDSHQRLNASMTLDACGIRPGMTLMLV